MIVIEYECVFLLFEMGSEEDFLVLVHCYVVFLAKYIVFLLHVSAKCECCQAAVSSCVTSMFQVRSGSAFMVHVCEDEHQLFYHFFSHATPLLE